MKNFQRDNNWLSDFPNPLIPHSIRRRRFRRRVAMFALMAVALTVYFWLAPTVKAESYSPVNEGYYSGSSTIYPYDPVYCERDDGNGACYGARGSLGNLPLSAPLPPGNKWCEWADNAAGIKPVGNGWAIVTGEGWYQWAPREVPKQLQPFIADTRICYFADRGKPININDLKQ